MDSSEKIYNIIWSIMAISGGILLLFPKSREAMLRNGIKVSMWWYKKTHLTIFKTQAEQMSSEYSRMITIIIGLISLILGVLTLSKNI